MSGHVARFTVSSMDSFCPVGKHHLLDISKFLGPSVGRCPNRLHLPFLRFRLTDKISFARLFCVTWPVCLLPVLGWSVLIQAWTSSLPLQHWQGIQHLLVDFSPMKGTYVFLVPTVSFEPLLSVSTKALQEQGPFIHPYIQLQFYLGSLAVPPTHTP